jgi:phage baseplate assembly protein W
MNYKITDDLMAVCFAPSNVTTEILQNVRTILKTRRGTVPLNRDFGLSWAYIDKPIHEAYAMIAEDIVNQLERYEPRAKIVSLELQQSNVIDGRLRPVLTVAINE